MSTKKGLWRRAVLWAAIGMGGLVASAAHADEVADQSAAILVFPKIRVVGSATNTAPKVDTIVQVTNAGNFLTKAHCFYVNANSHCSNAGAPSTIACTTSATWMEVIPAVRSTVGQRPQSMAAAATSAEARAVRRSRSTLAV